jgi:hypothetical protein
MEELLNWLGQNIGTYIGLLLIGISLGVWTTVKKFLMSKTSDKFNLNTGNCHSKINELLTEMRLDLNCSRVSLFQFHNGGKYLDGSSIMKISMSHESCGLYATPSVDNVQNIIISRFPELYSLITNTEMKLHYVEDLHPSLFKNILEARNDTCFYLIPIKDEDDINYYGFVLCNWTDNCLPENEQQAISSKIHEFANDVSFLFNSELRKLKNEK